MRTSIANKICTAGLAVVMIASTVPAKAFAEFLLLVVVMLKAQQSLMMTLSITRKDVSAKTRLLMLLLQVALLENQKIGLPPALLLTT